MNNFVRIANALVNLSKVKLIHLPTINEPLVKIVFADNSFLLVQDPESELADQLLILLGGTHIGARSFSLDNLILHDVEAVVDGMAIKSDFLGENNERN